MNILIINGPNLRFSDFNKKGTKWSENFDTFYESIQEEFKEIQFTYYQSNIEGEIVNKLHEFGFVADGIILNAGAYSQTSVAIRDAIAGIRSPVVEVKISIKPENEVFSNKSVIGPVCQGYITGFGTESYLLAVKSFVN